MTTKDVNIFLIYFLIIKHFENIGYDYLIDHFELSGSNIKNIALHSAFLAAAESSPAVGMKHSIAALKNEYSKSGKAFTKAEAGEYYHDIND